MSAGLPFLEGSTFARDFRIGRPLGSGGMGTVYVAEQLSTGKLRALKLMHPQLVGDDDLRARFEREARVSSSIESEHVAFVVDAGVDAASGMPWIAMELLDGEDLDAFVTRAGPLDGGALLALLRPVCHALGAAHRIGIVHRDLKPENVFVARSNAVFGETNVKVLDFGVAKVLAETRRSTATLGTPLWMSPEQSDPRAKVLPAADVWSLGLLTFWLVTGELFWRAAHEDGASLQAVLREILFDPIPAATERARELGKEALVAAWFDGWFARCVERDPAQRFADATEALAALEVALAGVVAAPLTLPAARPTPSRAPVALAATERSADAGGRGARRKWLVPMIAGVIVAFVFASAALGLAFGLFRAPVAPAKTTAPPAEPEVPLDGSASAVVPPPTAPPSAPPSVAPPPTVVTSASASAPPKPALRRFDQAAAAKEVMRFTERFSHACRSSAGPRVFNARMVFKQNGQVKRVDVENATSAATMSVLCATSQLRAMSIRPFDTPDVGEVHVTVALQ